MAWSDAKRLANEWAEKNLPSDLRGQMLQLVSFQSDSHCRFFYPDRTAEFHAMVTSGIARIARKRKALTSYSPITPDDYREWLRSQGKTDNDAKRLEFIKSCHEISPLS